MICLCVLLHSCVLFMHLLLTHLLYFNWLSSVQAIDSRDALAKFIYGSLFDWIVEQINKSLEVGKQCTGRSINILDIYGFESFKVHNLCLFVSDCKVLSMVMFSCSNCRKIALNNFV